MASKPTSEDVFDALLLKYEGLIGAAALAAFANLRSHADVQRLADALSRADAEDSLAALHLDPAAFADMNQDQRDAYVAGGLAAIALLPVLTDLLGRAIVLRFNPAAVDATAFVQGHTTQIVGRILADQQVAIRNLIQDGLAHGIDPRSLAIQIVGSINPASGVREGGIIGLTSPQEQFVRSARAELASADSDLLRNYLTRTLRDRRFDTAVNAALESGNPISTDVADRAVLQYQNRLLLARGRTVGTTEALQLLHAGQDEAFDQVIASGALGDSDTVAGTWRDVGDNKVRSTHQALSGESQPHGMPFTSPSGAMMLYPGDTSHGAGADEVANCRCQLVKRIVFRSNEQRAAA